MGEIDSRSQQTLREDRGRYCTELNDPGHTRAVKARIRARWEGRRRTRRKHKSRRHPKRRHAAPSVMLRPVGTFTISVGDFGHGTIRQNPRRPIREVLEQRAKRKNGRARQQDGSLIATLFNKPPLHGCSAASRLRACAQGALRAPKRIFYIIISLRMHIHSFAYLAIM